MWTWLSQRIDAVQSVLNRDANAAPVSRVPRHPTQSRN